MVAAAAVVRDGVRPTAVDPRLLAVPALYHGYYLALLVGLGMYREQPLLPAVSLEMAGLGVAFHLAGTRAARSAPPTGD